MKMPHPLHFGLQILLNGYALLVRDALLYLPPCLVVVLLCIFHLAYLIQQILQHSTLHFAAGF